MTFRIQRTTSGARTVLAISGEVAAGQEDDLRQSLDAGIGPYVVLDLAGLRAVTREGVRLLREYEARGATLGNCPGYVRTWIDTESQEDDMTTTSEAAAREDRITSSNGLQVFYRSWHPAGAPRTVVVIVPGFNSHSGYYGWVASQLTAAGAAVYALDLRGRGQSDGDRFYVEHFADYLADIDGVVQVARNECPETPLFVLGHSAGGVLACLYALEHQDRMAGLLCESFAFKTPAPEFALAVLKGLSHVFPHAHVLTLKNGDFSRDPEVVARMNADPLIANETQPTQTVAELVRADERLERAMPGITLPVLILHGTADKAARPSGSQAFFDAVGSRDKTLKLYEGAFHDLLNDVDRQVVMADIIGWLNTRVLEGSAS